MKVPSVFKDESQKRFPGLKYVAQAPGRINVIGEHTDYNDGFVLPAAIDLRCWTAASPRADRMLIVESANTGEMLKLDLDDLHPLRSWSDYPAGVAAEVRNQVGRMPGADLYIRGDVPLGAGLSSSAAIEVSCAYSLLKLAEAILSPTSIAQLCRRAENLFVGASCGIMDQFVSCHGEEGKALFLDCRSLEFRPVPIPHNILMVVCNTMVKHELSRNEYNRRRMECEEGVRIIAGISPSFRALRDATCTDLERARPLMSDKIYRRCRHVISENLRVQRMVTALDNVDTSSMAALMADSHRSLRDDFEVSCSELDLMVELANRQKGLLGARMLGGGFGGCTINLVKSEQVSSFELNMSDDYERETGVHPAIYICRASEGAGLAALS